MRRRLFACRPTGPCRRTPATWRPRRFSGRI